VSARALPEGGIEALPESAVEHVVHEGALAGAGDAGEARENAQGDGDVQGLQVVLFRAAHLEGTPGRAAAPRGENGAADFAFEVGAGEAAGLPGDLLRCPRGDDVAAVLARAGSHLDEVFRGEHGLPVVLHDEHGVAQVADFLQGLEQAPRVPGVQADGGLVEHVEHAREFGTNLGGEANPLAFAAAQGVGAPGEGEILRPHVHEEADAFLEFLQHLVGYGAGVFGKVEFRDGPVKVGHGHAYHVADAVGADLDGEGLGAKAQAAAGVADFLGAEPGEFFLHRVGLGLLPAAFEPGEETFVAPHVLLLHAALVVGHGDFVGVSLEDVGADLLGEFLEGAGKIPPQGLGEVSQAPEHVVLRSVPGQQGTLGDAAVGDHRQLGGEELVASEAHAGGAGAVGVVEGEEPRVDLGEGRVAVGAHVVLREEPLFSPLDDEEDEAGALREGGLHCLGKAVALVRPGGEPIHHDLHDVLLVLLQGDLLFEPVDDAVHPGPEEAFLADLLEEVAVLPLLAPHHRREDLDLFLRVVPEDEVHDLVQGIPGEGFATVGTGGHADSAEEEAQVVVDFRDGAHGGPGVVGAPLLLDGDGRGEPGDVLHIGLALHAEKLPRIGREGFDVAPLPLGVDGVERQGGLAGAGRPGDDHEAVLGNGDGDVLQVMFFCAPYDDVGLRHEWLHLHAGPEGGREAAPPFRNRVFPPLPT
jgi:hypothetical protein